MFEKCITCKIIGERCVPNLWQLPLPELMQWLIKFQKHRGWSNQKWADESGVPVGTINRMKAGDYTDCKYSTIRSLAISVMGGAKDEFSCTEQVEKELRQLEQLEKQNFQRCLWQISLFLFFIFSVWELEWGHQYLLLDILG